MFAYATGWLKWPPDAALCTPFPDIELALQGLGDFLVATTPGARPKAKKPSQAALQSKIKAMFGLRKAQAVG